MIRYVIGLIIAATCLMLTTAIEAVSSPIVIGDTSCMECKDALVLGVSQFNSKSSRLYAPLTVPADLSSRMVLGASDLDISGGHAVEANEEQFENLQQLNEHPNRNIYWGKHTDYGTRIVLKESSAGWRGDEYSLYLVNANVQQDDFLKSSQESYNKSKYKPLLGNMMRPPLIFFSKTQKMWFIEVGETQKILSDWDVYKATPNGFEKTCTIKFLPVGKNAMDLLPKKVRNFAYLVSQTIGTDDNNKAKHVWANATVRPWALSDSDTYNSSDEVKDGLLSWSKGSASFRRVYKEIMQSYPLVESSLANYYMRQFNLSKNQANTLAKWALDIAFRSNYTFSNGQDYFRYDNVNTNPWGDDYRH